MNSALSLTQRKLLSSSPAALSFGAVAAGIGPRFIRPGRAYGADALAAGMVGEPAGFDGSERYQYTPEARTMPHDSATGI